MKSERGVTLTSLIVYIIAMLLVVGILAVISRYFYRNINNINESIEPHTEYTTFNSYFTDEVNHNGIKVLDCATTEDKTESYIFFDNGVQYTFIQENEGIYRNKVKICRGVKQCEFIHEIKDGKDTITVNVNFGKDTKTITYTLK